MEKQKEYTHALEICNLALNNPKRFNKPTWEGVRDKFTKRKNRLLDKIAKNHHTTKIPNEKVSSSKSGKDKIDTDIIPINNDISKEIVYPDWYISISFGESKSQSFAQSIALAQMAPQFIINNVEGKNLYQAIYSDKPNEYLQFIKLSPCKTLASFWPHPVVTAAAISTASTGIFFFIFFSPLIFYSYEIKTARKDKRAPWEHLSPSWLSIIISLSNKFS